LPIAARLERFLGLNGIAFRELGGKPESHFDAAVTASGRSADEFVRASLLIDINGPLMVVHGYNTTIDTELVHKITG